MISITGIIVKLANHSPVICAQFKNVGSTILYESFTAHFSRRKIFTIPFTHRKLRIKRHPDCFSLNWKLLFAWCFQHQPFMLKEMSDMIWDFLNFGDWYWNWWCEINLRFKEKVKQSYRNEWIMVLIWSSLTNFYANEWQFAYLLFIQEKV